MTGRASGIGLLADWTSLAAAALFAGVGMLTIRHPETDILRLAALGLPAWPAYGAAGIEIAAAGLLLHRPARVPAALVLAVLSLGGVGLCLAYRESASALEALGLAVLAAVVLILERRRP